MGQKLSLKNEKKNNQNDFIYYVKKNIRKYYKFIQNNKINYLIALEKKYFDKENNFKNRIDLNNINNIKITNWKEYFINYINKSIKKENFFNKILEKIKKETFLSENKYLSSMFFYDFELRTKPEFFNKIDKKINKNKTINVLFKKNEDYSNNNNNIIENNLTNEIKKLNFNFFNENNQNKFENNNNNNLSKIVLNLDNFNESVYNSENNSNKSSFISNENTFNLKTIKKRIKKIINIFKEHLINKDHPITILIIIFEEEFSFFLYEKINEMKDLKNDENYENKINFFSDKIINLIKTFIIKIQTCLKLFYCSAFNLNLNYLHYEKDQTINLCVSLLFNIGNLYSNIYDFFNLLLNDEIENFNKLLKKYKNISFDDLNIPIKFRLNFETKKLILNLKNKKNIENFINDDKNNNNKNNKNEEDGYLNVINKLKSIEKSQIPFEKMLIISSLPNLITSNINEFYFSKENDYNYLKNPNYLNLISDDLISIFIYVLIKSQMSSILIHLKIMNDFIPNSTQKNNYYITTLKGAIQFIQQDEIIKNNNNNNNFEINS